MPLSNYGTPIRSYEGTGTLRLRSGATLECSFEAGQYPNGDVLVLTVTPQHVWGADEADGFTGRTPSGDSLDAELDIPINVLGDSPGRPSGTYFAHRAKTLRICSSSAAAVATHRYGIVNFRFFGTNTLVEHDASERPVRHGWHLDLRLPDERGPVAVDIDPLHGYSAISTELITIRETAVTCEAVIDVATLPPQVNPDAVVTDLCLLLSVARGTLVQWLYRRDLDASGAEVGTTYFSHITRRYQGLEPLDHRPLAREHTKRFVEGAYARLPAASRMYELRHTLLPAYLDSRSEDDYLEMRGVKVAVVAEMIKAQHGGAAVVLSAKPWTIAWLRSWSQRLRQRRHRQFASALREACRAAGYYPSRSTINDFVASRNRLVHVGRFRADPRAPRSSRFEDSVAEYAFMMTFLDRFFLRLLGYSGPFLDWSRYPEHEQGTV